MFNFGISKESAVKTSKPQLKPWEIHDVKFVGCEIAEGTSKNDESKSWKRLDIKFENENGYFNVPLWFPKSGDDKRPEYEGKNGGTVTYPSAFELLMATVAQTAQILNPAGFEKMQALSSKFKDFDDVAKALMAILEKSKGTETKLKLIGKVDKDGRVNAQIPRILGINKQGESFISDNYIGNKLFFSTYEEGKRKEYLNSKPTTMSNTESKDPLLESAEYESNEELNLEDLL
jgi:hypothetical protein